MDQHIEDLDGVIAVDQRDGTTKADIDATDAVLMLKRGGTNKREIDTHELSRLLKQPITHAFVEHVGSMPGQGVSSVFTFGKSFGIVLGILAAHGVPMTLASPRSWKTKLQVPAAKDAARFRASQLLPQAAHHWPLKKHDGRAEAALLALYGSRVGSVPRPSPTERRPVLVTRPRA